MLAPLGERTVRAAADRERIAEDARLDAERAAEPERLDVRADARPEEDVVRRLRNLAGPHVADAHGGLEERLARTRDGVDGLLRAAAVQDELPFLRAALASDQRRVDHANAALRCVRREL